MAYFNRRNALQAEAPPPAGKTVFSQHRKAPCPRLRAPPDATHLPLHSTSAIAPPGALCRGDMPRRSWGFGTKVSPPVLTGGRASRESTGA